MLEAVQSGVERPLVHPEHFLRHLPDALSIAPAVHGFKSKGLED
jgi:ribosome maturation factor RimP